MRRMWRGRVLALVLAGWVGVGAASAEVRVHEVATGPEGVLPAGAVRVAAWNIQWFPGQHPSRATPETMAAQTAAVRGELEAMRPHVLLAMEIRDEAAWRTVTPDFAFHHVTAIPRPPDENPDLPNQGLAVAARTVPRACWVVDFSGLPQTPDRPVRGLLGAEFRAADGGRLAVYVVHLKSNRGEAASNRLRRQRAIEALIGDWRRRGLDPARDRIVVAGDFNTSPHDPQFEGERTLALLEEAGMVRALAGLPPEQRFTIAAGAFPPNDFDHIFVSGAQAGRMAGPPPWGGVRRFVPTASDHAAVWIDLR